MTIGVKRSHVLVACAAIASVFVLGLLLARQPDNAGARASASCPSPKGAGGKCKVVLVNSFLGNDYRTYMQRVGVLASKKPAFTGWEPLTVLNTDNTAEAQNAGMQNLLQKGVNAILLDSVSDTSARNVIKLACAQGVTVITFDVTDKSNASCEYRIDFKFKHYVEVASQWVAKKLNCKGTVIVDKGLSGVSVANDQYQGQLAGLKDICGDKIKIVATYSGQFGPGVLAQVLPGIIASHPQIDAVFADTNCEIVGRAFKAAGRKLPITWCGYANPGAAYCVQNHMQCIQTATSWAPSIQAMCTLKDIWAGKTVPKQQYWNIAWYATDTSVKLGKLDGAYEKLAIGKNTFPKKSASWTPLYNWPGACVQLSEKEAYG